MKHFISFFLLLQFALLADDPIVIEDRSGLTDKELRQVATDSDDSKKEKVSLKEVYNVTDKEGKVDVSKLESTWEELSPTPKKYDWVQTKSGEWFKGEIKAMYDNELEFDSDEIGLYNFDFDDIKQIKSFHVISANIEKSASIAGILRFKDNNLTIIQGDESFTFFRESIVSLAKSADKEINNWSGKITLNLDMRYGNKDQFDYSAKANINRRTSSSRLRLDYLGRLSRNAGVQTANDHRINQKFDLYLSRRFFWTPLFSEYYEDSFQNIKHQYTLGVGVGYTLIDKKGLEWDISGGPAVLKTVYEAVSATQKKSQTAASLEVSTKVEYEVSKITDITYDAKFTFTQEQSGGYKHHMLLVFENELLSWLDFDITAIWDYTKIPKIDGSGITPQTSDYQFLIGLGVEF